MRVPLRWAMIAYTGLAAFAAAGTLPLLRARRRWVNVAAAATICAVMLFELRPAIRWHLTADTPAVYTWLANTPITGAVLELPITDTPLGYEYLLHETVHRRPLLNGVSSFTPGAYARLADAARSVPIPDSFMDEIRNRRASLIVVHVDDFYERRPVIRDWLRAELQRGRLLFLKRFDHHVSGDYVFAVAPFSAEVLRLLREQSNDPAGRASVESLRLLLDGDRPTHNQETFGFLGTPTPGQDARRELRVDGWALSPHGVVRVDLLFEQRRIRIEADRYEAPWVTRPHPWYAPGPPGFRKLIDRRPHGVSADTDLEIEITDALGHVRRIGPVAIRWSDEAGLRADDWNVEALDGLLTRLGDEPQSARELVLTRRMTLAGVSDRLVEQSRRATDEEFVIHAHQVIFGQDPDQKTLRRWTEKLSRGQLRVQVTDYLLGSPAFAERYLKPGVRMERLRG